MHFLLEVGLPRDSRVLSSWQPRLLAMLGRDCLEVGALRAQEVRRWTQGYWSVRPARERVCVRRGHLPGGSSFLHFVEFRVEAVHRLWSPS